MLLFSSLAICTQFCSNPTDHVLISPSGTFEVITGIEKNAMRYTLLFKGDTLIQKSRLGIQVDSLNLSQNIVLNGVKKDTFDESWESVTGKNKTVRNRYNEMTLFCQTNTIPALDFSVQFRSYDDGIAFRYILPEQESLDMLTITGDYSEVNFADDFIFWAANGERHNLGPLKRSQTSLDAIRIPLVARTDNDIYVALHEAATFDLAPIHLEMGSQDYMMNFVQETSIAQAPVKTSWRVVMVGERPGALVESDLLANLNGPCKIEDTSWIKPGKTMWDWRVWGYKAPDGFEYGLNTESHKRFIDFASENNVQYLLIDADWYGPEFSQESDPTDAREGIDIEACMAYAREKGVGVILYLNDVGAKKFGLERVLKQFAEWGAVGVKYGFMQGSPQEKVLHTRRVVELCAKYKLMVNFHDNPVPPSGDDRTWPNLMTREFCHSQADAMRSYFPETAVTSPFVNMIAGPLDMCNGWFGFNEALTRVKVFEEIPGTVAAEVAKLIVIFSGWSVLPDAPEEYLKKEDLFECIRNMPAAFDGFQVLDGEIGEYILVARKAGPDWFIGCLTNRDERTVEMDFGFLPEKVTYKAHYYEDAPDTHFLNNKEAYQVRHGNVTSKDVEKIRMAPGGGFAIHLVRE